MPRAFLRVRSLLCVAAVVFPASAAGLAGCDSTTGGQFSSLSSSSSTGTTTTGSGGSGSGGSTTASTGSSKPSCIANLPEAANAEFCAWDPANIDCSLVTGLDKNDVCGVPVAQPTMELKRSSGLKEFSGSGAPQVDCYAKDNYPTQGDASKTVKIKGVAKIFSAGCMSNSLTIEIYKVNRSGDPAEDGDLGELVGTSATTEADCTADGTQETILDDQGNGCTPRYDCPYEYDGVPQETELVAKTYGDQWAPLYEYNLYIPASEVQSGVWNHDVRALAAGDYGTIAVVATGAPIEIGNGAIAGEVHDCGDVRLSNAVVNIDQKAGVVDYFTPDEDKPLPDPTAVATAQLGLYTGINIAPGPITVAAAGLSNGKVVTLGYFRARIFPDSVTAVTFHGLFPSALAPSK